MNDESDKNRQFEFFPSSSEDGQGVKKMPHLFKELKLSTENLLVVCIVFIMFLVLTFSLGVERGKGFTKKPDSGTKISTLQNIDNEVLSETLNAKNTGARMVVTTAEMENPKLKEERIEILELPDMEDDPIDFNNYTIQVASFKLERNAQKEALNLKNKGFEAIVLSRGSYSIVCVGKFLQRAEASAYTNQLKSRYKDLLVRRL
jgi:hypothetical protein